jgi:hypothetical protein
MNDQERLKILSDAIREMASDAFEKSDAEEDQRGEWIAVWIDNYLCEDLLEGK